MFGAQAGTTAPPPTRVHGRDRRASAAVSRGRAIALAAEGDIQAAHDILQKIPESSSVREEPEYRELEDRWADAMFEKAEEASALEEKLRLFTLVADATTVSMEKRRFAADKVYELTPEEDRKKNPRPYLGPPTPRPPSTWEPPPPVAPKTATPAPKDDKPEPKVPEKFDENAQKKALMNKAMSGKATETELRMLKAICMNDGDRACRDMAVAQLAALKNQ
jgi:ABC transport system ATP-binding/permease protein